MDLIDQAQEWAERQRQWWLEEMQQQQPERRLVVDPPTGRNLGVVCRGDLVSLLDEGGNLLEVLLVKVKGIPPGEGIPEGVVCAIPGSGLYQALHQRPAPQEGEEIVVRVETGDGEISLTRYVVCEYCPRWYERRRLTT